MSIYTPEHFRSDNPPPRIMGTEMEYMLGLKNKEDYSSAMAVASIARNMHGGFEDTEHFLPNGARVYADVGNVEYATPECLGPREQVCAEMAGQLIVKKAASRWNEGNGHLYRRTGGLDSTGAKRSIGYHQNFLTVPYATLAEQRHDAQVIGAHLASRVIWSGNGSLARRYALSQKAHDIQLSGESATVNNDFFDGNILRIGDYGDRTVDLKKPLLVWSRWGGGAMEAHAGGWERIEIRYADANHSPESRILSMGSISLVLRLLEHKDHFDKDIWRGLRIKRLSEAVREISADLTLRGSYEMVSGESLTAVDLQRRLAEMALDLSQKVALPNDELAAAYAWNTVCDDLEAYRFDDEQSLSSLSENIEWAARLLAIQRQNQRSNQKLISRQNVVAARVDQAWDLVYPASIAEGYWRRKQPDFFAKHDPLIEEFIYRPPRFTRAHRRSAALKNGCRTPVGRWDKVKDRRGKEILYLDPYNYGD